MRSYQKSGFSLIELLIWVATFAITSGMIVWLLPSALRHARDAKRKHDLVVISRGLEAYYNITGHYPQTLPDCYQPLMANDEITLARFPCNYTAAEPYRYVVDEGEMAAWYKLYTNLEVTTDPIINKLHCLSGCGPECAYNYGRASTNTTIDNCAKTYVCAPGGGATGFCEVYEDPDRSECPEIYYDIPDCNNECSDPRNRCKNASGKTIPE